MPTPVKLCSKRVGGVVSVETHVRRHTLLSFSNLQELTHAIASCEKFRLGSITWASEASAWFDDVACISRKSPNPLSHGGDAPDQSGAGVSAVMRLLSGSAPSNVSNS